MILAEKLFALRAQFPFSQLKSEELLIIANAAVERIVPAGRVVVRKGGTLNCLFIRIAGDLVDDRGTPVHPIVGTTVLLTGCEPPYTVRAGVDGYRGLCLPRGKFLTIVNECPTLLVGFFQMPIVGSNTPALRRASP